MTIQPQFVERVCVNYLRHRPPYERHLREIPEKVGRSQIYNTYKAYKTNVLRAIAKIYPWLAEECKRQEQRLHEDPFSD
jgi:hypothetical protein